MAHAVRTPLVEQNGADAVERIMRSIHESVRDELRSVYGDEVDDDGLFTPDVKRRAAYKAHVERFIP